MKELFQRSEQIEDHQPVSRDLHWWKHKLVEEAQEVHQEDPEQDRHAFLLEGADVVIAWIGAMRAAGVGWEVAFEAIEFKFDILEERLKHTATLMEEGMEHDVAYETAKGVK